MLGPVGNSAISAGVGRSHWSQNRTIGGDAVGTLHQLLHLGLRESRCRAMIALCANCSCSGEEEPCWAALLFVDQRCDRVNPTKAPAWWSPLVPTACLPQPTLHVSRPTVDGAGGAGVLA